MLLAQFYLEDLLVYPIDLGTGKALRPKLRPYVEREAVDGSRWLVRRGFTIRCFSHNLENRDLKTAVKSQSIAFKHPPVSEVVVSTYFNPPLSDLRSEHIGLFWREIKGDFPVVNQQPPVGIGPDAIADGPFPMPRYWLIADNEINLIQIQKNAFMFNWRRGDHAYPRFHKDIKPTFDKYYGLFNEFIRTEINISDPTVDLCELVYVNTLERCEYWTGLQDTTKVIPSFSILAPGIDASESLGFNCNYGYKATGDLQLNIGIRSGVRSQQQNAPVLIFEIKASGRLGPVAKSRADEWFERAHDTIIESFLGMTNPVIQNQFWKPVEDVS